LPELFTTIVLAGLSAAAWVAAAVEWLRGPALLASSDDREAAARRDESGEAGSGGDGEPHEGGWRGDRAVSWVVWLCSVGSGGLFVLRALGGQAWLPLRAHVDGLLLMAALFGAAILYLQQPARLPGVRRFALPVLGLLLLWAICASHWTLHMWRIDSMWKALHLGSVYLGGLFFAVAAVAAGLYLRTQRRLRHKKLSVPATDQRGASLERTERFLVRFAALGFAVLSLGVLSGVVLSLRMPGEGAGGLSGAWWIAPKVLLSALVWLIFAVVANLRFATRFRGARAAWLSIAGFALVLVIFGISVAVPEARSEPADFPAGPVGEPAAIMPDLACHSAKKVL